MKKKRAMTLLEIMIVILIIGIVGSVIGYNMRGSLEEGKAFKTREGTRQLYEVFQLEMAKGAKVKEIKDDPEKYLVRSGIVRKPQQLLRDGWGDEYTIVQSQDGKDIRIWSDRHREYCQKKGIDIQETYPWEENTPSPS